LDQQQDLICKEKATAVFKKYKIQPELTVAPLPQTNGIAERAEFSIKERVRSILVEILLPHILRPGLSVGVMYLLNRCPRGTTKKLHTESSTVG
jgi:hypothetical protein